VSQQVPRSVPGEEAIFARINQLLQDAGHLPAQLQLSRGHNCIQVKLTGVRCWVIEVECSLRAQRLPGVWLIEPEKVLLAHVSYDGVVCIDDGQGLSFDPARRDDIVAQVTLDAFHLLERSYADSQADYTEFFNELEGYWTHLPASMLGWADVEIAGPCRLLTGYNAKHEAAPADWFFTEQSAKKMPPEFRLKGLPDVLGIYVPLERGILPPHRDTQLSTHFVQQALAMLDDEGKRAWERLVKNRTTKVSRLSFMLISVPRAAGGYSLIGLTFHVKAGAVDTSKCPTPIRMERHTSEFMRERGGADLGLASKRIAILGCGSVGSEVADALASSGVGNLVLVDSDDLGVENVFRHLLGRDMLGEEKVTGVQKELLRKYPGAAVAVRNQVAQPWLRNGGPQQVDGIVIAIGVPTVEREFMRYLRGSGATIPVVLTWLEPLDLGGHAVGLSTTGKGCLDCLYRDDEGVASLYPCISFLASGQVVTKNLTGCASTFVPYGAIQSRRTALLAAELMLDLLRGENAPQYRYWQGKGKLAAAEGLRNSPWFTTAQTADQNAVSKHLFANPCAMCREQE